MKSNQTNVFSHVNPSHPSGDISSQTVLVVGASGATGRWAVKILLDRGLHVRAIVRDHEKIPLELRKYSRLTIIRAAVLEIAEEELTQHMKDCFAVLSFLGHNLSFKGIFGAPRFLVTEAVRRICLAIKNNQPAQPVRFVLMNTAGNSNQDIPEKTSFPHRCVIGLIRLLLPPHRDNEQAADYLRKQISPMDRFVQWTVVRPDTLINENEVSLYDVYPSPSRSAIFNPGKTSRINVAHFMTELVLNDETWKTWKGQMPVIYNQK